MRQLAPVLFILLVAGCGFHLRGAGGVELAIQSVAIESANIYSEFSQVLARLLAAQNINVVDADPEYTIVVRSEKTARRPVATSLDLTASEYELRMTVAFEVRDGLGAVALPLSTVTIDRIYSFDRNNFVGNAEEEELLKAEMRRDISGQLIRRMGATLKTLDTTIPKNESSY